MISRKPTARAAALGAAAATFLLAACGGSSSGTTATAGSSSSGNAASGEKVTLKVNFWGDFGLDALAKDYEASHPNVHIQLNPGDYNAQHDALQKSIVAGSGAPDISAIDEGFVVQFRSQSDKFVNLLDEGLGSYESKYLPWKWKQSLSADGKTQIGLGTDVGGLAMCYRSDLFAKAGLPTDRAAVSALWPTWDKFQEVGKQYVAKSGGAKFIDAASNIMNPVLGQQAVGYYDTNEALQMDGGPKAAWDIATKFITDGTSANLVSFTPAWDAAFKNGKFAVLACPAWMGGYIKGKAPETSGKWDIADIPGGGGNWGGSFWTIPKQGKHVKEAVEFIKWAVDPAQQLAIFKKVGNLPSQPDMFKDPALVDFANPFFSNAPVGKIYTDSASKLQPQYLGKKSGPTRVAVEAVLTKVQQGKVTPEAGWAEAKAAAEKASKA
jgi:cellobiose transport system substrate-binding protein